MRTEFVDPDSVEVLPRLRELDEAKLVVLAESMKELGLRTPISIYIVEQYVKPDTGRTAMGAAFLIAGYHRLEAARRLGWPNIECIVAEGTQQDFRLWEIAENLHRAELSEPERRQHIAEWVKLTQANLQSTHDAVIESKRQDGRGHRKEEAMAVAAKTLGVSKDTVARAVAAESLSDAVKAAADEAGLGTVKRAVVAKEATVEAQFLKVDVIAGGDTAAKKPHNHRAQYTGDVEWYTPPEYIEAARRVMGAIDLDPASNTVAQKTVQAHRFFTREDDGLAKTWKADRVWLNPPYAQPWIAKFVDKLVAELNAGNVNEAILLTHNSSDTEWFRTAQAKAVAMCFTKGRIKFVNAKTTEASPTQGQTFFYFGSRPEAFEAEFQYIGFGVLPAWSWVDPGADMKMAA